MSKTLDDIITGRISRMINYVDKPEDLLEQIDNLRYFVEKKLQQVTENKESLQPLNQLIDQPVGVP